VWWADDVQVVVFHSAAIEDEVWVVDWAWVLEAALVVS
jgi:hypothetical protein